MDGLIAYTTNFIEHHPDDGEEFLSQDRVFSRSACFLENNYEFFVERRTFFSSLKIWIFTQSILAASIASLNPEIGGGSHPHFVRTESRFADRCR